MVWQAAVRSVSRHRVLLKNVVSYGAVLGSADICCQLITNSLGTIQWDRAGRFMALGTTVLGPVYHFYFRALDNKFVGTSTNAILKKLAIDQLISGPVSLFVFFGALSIMERKTMAEFKQEMKDKYVRTLLIGYAVWPLAQTINFLYVPPAYRVIYVGCIAFLWNVFLSYVKNNKSLPQV